MMFSQQIIFKYINDIDYLTFYCVWVKILYYYKFYFNISY